MRTCSVIQLCLALWTVARQAPLSVGFFRQEHWNGLPFPSLGDLPDPGIEPTSPVSPVPQVVSLPLSHWGGPLNSGIFFKVIKFENTTFRLGKLCGQYLDILLSSSLFRKQNVVILKLS